jgi:CheY-like chemotaxis protein
MIVDDEADVVTLLKFLLMKDGHAVTSACNGEDALGKLGADAELPDLIVMDVMMPVMDGYALSAKLAQDARTRAIPVIVLTAKGEMRDLFHYAPNVAAYIDKPFDPKTLRDLIASMVAA